MIVRANDITGDWTFGAGKNNYLSANAAVAQLISTRLSSFLGDCFFATSEGIDWFNLLGAKNETSLTLAISTVILNTPNVIRLEQVALSLDANRVLTVTYNATTAFGTVEQVVVQNLGVAFLVTPSNPLFAQYRQILLNNIGATAITSAVFDPTIYWEVDLDYFIERRTSTQGFTQRGKLICKWDQYTSLWGIEDFVFDGSSGPTTGVAFTIDTASGQVSYASDNMTGSSYVGQLEIQGTQFFLSGI